MFETVTSPYVTLGKKHLACTYYRNGSYYYFHMKAPRAAEIILSHRNI